MLYFIQDGDRIKIGVAESPLKREKALQTGNPNKHQVVLAIDLKNDREIEQALHARLKYCQCRESGEWFNLSFASAVDQLCELRKLFNTGDNPSLPLESDAKPKLKLEDVRGDFELWVRERCWKGLEWDQQKFPVEYYWEFAWKDFLEDPNNINCLTETEAAERFKLLRQQLSED